MAISIKPASTYTPKISHKFMKSMASGGLARFIALEAFVEAGRTYQAYKRGGFDEGRERITEEFTGAVFWLGGVKAFNKMNDKIGKWLLNMRTTDFDLGKDSARDVVANFLHKEKNTKTGMPFTADTIAKFKAAKLIASILMANAMIGFVVPKINQGITRYYHRNDKPAQSTDLNNQTTNNNSKRLSMQEYLKNIRTDNTNPSFGGSTSALMSLAYNLENNTTWQLLSTDIGTATGRTISARNNDERREILFRDLSSVLFYMFNMPLMNKGLNLIEHGKGSRADSINAYYTKDLMKDILKEHGGHISAENLESAMFGDKPDFKLPKTISDKFKDGFMTIDEFKKLIPSIADETEVAKYTKIAEDMAKLQPSVEGIERITKSQAERVFKGGYLNNPEFLKNLYELSFGKDKKLDLANFLNPYKFISTESVDGVDNDIKHFVEKIINKSRKSGEKITEEILEKAAKKNFRLNVINWGTGFAVSALFLSTLIPKMQYWLTKHFTGSDAFPGTEEYRKANESKNDIK